MTQDQLKVAVIGCGIQGKAIIQRLINSSCKVKAYDCDHAELQATAELGADIADTLEQACEGVSHILIVVTAGKAPLELLSKPEVIKQLNSNQMILQMGSCSKQDTLEMHTVVEATGAKFVECILFGPRAAILEGQCGLLFAGTKEQHEQAQPLWQFLGNAIYIGEVGSATVFNLSALTNLYAMMHAFALSTAMIQRSGINMDLWLAFVKNGFGPTPDAIFKLFTEFFWPVHFKERQYPLVGPCQFKNDSAKIETELLQSFAASTGLNTELLEALKKVQTNAYQTATNIDWSSIYEILAPSKTE